MKVKYTGEVTYILWNFVAAINYFLTLAIFMIIITNGKVTNSTDVSVNSASLRLFEQKYGFVVYRESYVDTSSNQTFENSSSFVQQAQLRNILPDSYFCGQILGGHYMFGSPSSFCGGFTVSDCSAQCFYRNFTYFQCEGFVCHCFTQ